MNYDTYLLLPHFQVDLTWSPPPPKIKSFDTILKTPFNNQKKSIKDLEIIYYNDSNSCLNITKNVIIFVYFICDCEFNN